MVGLGCGRSGNGLSKGGCTWMYSKTMADLYLVDLIEVYGIRIREPDMHC